MEYGKIFSGHVIRILQERKLTRQELAARAGISNASITEVTRESPNPTLSTMIGIAQAFQIPLPLLLKPLECEEWQAILAISQYAQEDAKKSPVLPDGYGIVNAILPLHKVYVVEQWALQAKKKTRK